MGRDQRLIACAAGSAAVVGTALFWLIGHGLSPELLIAAVLGLVVVVAALVEPFWALLLLLVVVYLRPADRLPALAPFRLQLLMMGITALFLIIQQSLADRPPRLRHPANGWVLAFLAAGLWATLPSQGLAYTVKVLSEGIGSSMLLYFLVSNLAQTGPRLRAVVWTLGVMGAVNVVLAVLSLRAGGNQYAGRLAGVGLLNDPNDLALSLVMIVPLLLGLWQGSRGPARLGAGGLAAVLVAGILGTRSRGGLLALLAVLFLTGYRRIRSPRWRVVYVVLALALALGTVHRVFAARGYGLTSMGRDISVQGRLTAWKGGLRMMADHPLRGVGLYQFPTAFLAYRPKDFEFVTLTAHNSLILVAGELAWPGLLTFLPLLGTLLVAAARARRQAPERDEPELRQSVELCLAGWMVAAMFLSQSYHVWLYIGAGLVVAADRGRETAR
ncbi:MAG: O-antigen ligase family protein [Armatimonadetes bacterium]|nr:O-antigen ligase family protein [Armatimonadota bacterium]